MPLNPVHAPLPSRLADALPDALTALGFLALWCVPHWLPATALRTALLVMIVEFVLMHAAGMLGNLAMSPGSRRGWRLPGMLALAALYGLFVAAWSWWFGDWWPALALGWLLLSRTWLLFRPLPPADRLNRLRSEWALGALAYVTGLVLTTLLPMPALGLTPEMVAAAGLPFERGLWLRQPQSVVAFGAFYFAAMALVRGFDWRLPGTAWRGIERRRA